MDEADALGDTIAILDGGKLRAFGTSLFLKRTYGKGHTVTLLSEPDGADRVAGIVKETMPSAEILSSVAGNTSVSLPRAAMKGLPRLFKAAMAEDGLVKEVILHAIICLVFMGFFPRISNSADFMHGMLRVVVFSGASPTPLWTRCLCGWPVKTR